ncbi:hypothetical protein E4T56_gene9685, partial [Termitomyces sp. T112]
SEPAAYRDPICTADGARCRQTHLPVIGRGLPRESDGLADVLRDLGPGRHPEPGAARLAAEAQTFRRAGAGEGLGTSLSTVIASEAKQSSNQSAEVVWIASSQELLAMTEFALAEELQQQREQVDEVQVKRQRTGDGCTLRNFTSGRGVAVDVVVLQPLGIPGGEAREHQHADDRHDEL